MLPTFKLENELLSQGFTLIAGIDEAGRGPWAGPLVAAAIILDVRNFPDQNIRDSKKVTVKRRNELYSWLQENCLSWAIGEVSSAEIDQLGLQMANKTAMKRAIGNLKIKPDYILTDYVGRISFRTPFQSLVRGDVTSISIAAASIIAKVYRDGLMLKFHEKYPEYRFDLHKGYGTALHQEMLKKHGICQIHRRCFAPIKRHKDIQT